MLVCRPPVVVAKLQDWDPPEGYPLPMLVCVTCT
jgi:hypothetical protein